MTTQCQICHENASKYKCPLCLTPYCSPPCFKTHKSSQTCTSTNSGETTTTKRDRPGTTQRVKTTLNFTDFEKDEEFQRLLLRFPGLKVQLAGIYGLTLDPGPGEGRNWNRGEVFGGERGRGRGRGGRGGAALSDRPRGAWTQEKGDLEALSMIKKMRSGAEEDVLAEGMREFVELCRMRFGERRA